MRCGTRSLVTNQEGNSIRMDTGSGRLMRPLKCARREAAGPSQMKLRTVAGERSSKLQNGAGMSKRGKFGLWELNFVLK